ncbi:MAG: glycosyltransferase family 4 protein [Gaiellaceae bacterium]
MSAERPVVVVVSPYRAEYGPPQTLGHVARALVDAGITPLCVVPERSRRSPELQRIGAEVAELPHLSTIPRTLNAGRLAAFLRLHVDTAGRIEKLARGRGARAVYSISEATFAGCVAAKRLNVPSIVHVIGMSIQSPRLGAHAYIRLLDRLSDQFIACSAAVAEMLVRFGTPDGKITVVHNGVSVPDILASEQLEPPVDGADGGPRIGMLAAYDPRKGHELFVEAAAIVAERFPAARFYLIGGVLDGHPESQAFEQRVDTLIRELGLESRFVRPGYVPPPQVYSWIRALDVVVVPSKTEAFAHAVPEAMLCKVPVVATAIEGNLDAFVNGHSGVFALSSPLSIATRVSELLDDPEKRRTIGEAAFQHAQLFDLGVTLPALGAAVWRTLERGRPR